MQAAGAHWVGEPLTPKPCPRLLLHAAYRARKAADPLAERRHGPKAGPKGVLADKAWHDHLAMKAVRAGQHRAGRGARARGQAAVARLLSTRAAHIAMVHMSSQLALCLVGGWVCAA